MGKQVQIVSVGPDHTLQLNKKELERILLAPNVKDKPVALVSIMGAFRQGKSFLMNFLMRYLRSHDKTNWMGDEDTPLEGFSWSTGTERNTIGIHVWDEVFLVRTPTGGELAVLLMDTQGAFDSDTSADETANLFALSILTSSVQIYNISKNIQEDHLQHLQLVAEYCMETQESPTGSQFQKLVFLIRDWQYPDDNAYGAVGGRSHLEQFISTSTQQHQDNKDLRKSLDSCFSSLDCFLMPHPGKETTRKVFDGRLSKLDDDFKQELRVLVPWLIGAEHLDAKRIAGKRITCKQLLDYFTVYTNVFKDGKRPHVATVLQATAEESNRNAKEEAKTFYVEQIQNVIYESIQELEEIHESLLQISRDIFRAARKTGGEDVKKRYLDMLEKEITMVFNCLCEQQKASELQKMYDEVMATSNVASKKLQKIEEKEKELEKAKQFASNSSGGSQKQKSLHEYEEELERLKREYESKLDDLVSKAEAYRQEAEKLRRQIEELMSEAKKVFEDRDPIWSFLKPVLTQILISLAEHILGFTFKGKHF